MATESISDGSEGILLESVLEGMAEYYSAELSEKVLRGSLLKLDEDTSYELEVSVADKTYQRSFKTRKFDFPVAETVYLTKKDCGRTFKPKSGSPGKYIRYTAKPGFVFNSGKNAGIGILIENAQYIILDGLTITGGKFNAVRIRNSKHIVVTNCDISGFGQGGVFRPDLDGNITTQKINQFGTMAVLPYAAAKT